MILGQSAQCCQSVIPAGTGRPVLCTEMVRNHCFKATVFTLSKHSNTLVSCCICSHRYSVSCHFAEAESVSVSLCTDRRTEINAGSCCGEPSQAGNGLHCNQRQHSLLSCCRQMTFIHLHL